jgi:MFS family permease
MTITFVASEALAVVTVMPIVARDLGGLRLYGWVFSAFMLGSLVGIVAAGRDADRTGPARPYVAGLVLFGTGLVVAGLAPSMPVLVLGRALQGVGAGAIPAVAYVVIGRTLPENLRPRMMAVLSTAWVVPGLVGPALSAAVEEHFGWRWVFLGLLPLVMVSGPIAIPALLRLGRPEATHEEEHRLADGTRTAVGTALLLGGLTSDHPALAVALVIAGAFVGFPALRRLLPPGTLIARTGLPATILSRGLLTFAFFGADAFVTLTISTVRHESTTMAGVAVTGATLSWTIGSWMQHHLSGSWQGRRLVRAGLVLILAGIAGMAASLRSDVPVAEAIAAWTVAGLGMGLAYAPLSLMMLRVAPPGREGWASASLNLSDVLGVAIGVGLGGAAVAAASSVSTGVAVAYALAGASAIGALAVTRRLPVDASIVEGGKHLVREPL